MRSYTWYEWAYRAHESEPVPQNVSEEPIDKVKKRLETFIQLSSRNFEEKSKEPGWLYLMLGLIVPSKSSIITNTSFLKKRYHKLVLHIHPDKNHGWVHANEAFHLLKKVYDATVALAMAGDVPLPQHPKTSWNDQSNINSPKNAHHNNSSNKKHTSSKSQEKNNNVRNTNKSTKKGTQRSTKTNTQWWSMKKSGKRKRNRTKGTRNRKHKKNLYSRKVTPTRNKRSHKFY